MKALISGGNGDIAQALKKQLEKLGWEVDAPSSAELDVTDIYNVDAMLCNHKYDLIVNNAGIIIPDNVRGSSPSIWSETIRVNLIGTYFVCRTALDWGNPMIINIASTSGLKGRAGWSAYCASKAGVISLTESLKEEGVDAHCIVLGRTNTKMRRELFPNEDPKTLRTINSVVKEILCLLK